MVGADAHTNTQKRIGVDAQTKQTTKTNMFGAVAQTKQQMRGADAHTPTNDWGGRKNKQKNNDEDNNT